MNRYCEKLSEFISEKKQFVSEDRDLTKTEKQLFRSLKTMGERSVQGRDVDSHLFEVVHKGDRVTLRMLIEGKHAMSVGNHVAKRFRGMDELEFVDVIRTKNGAKVVLRPVNE